MNGKHLGLTASELIFGNKYKLYDLIFTKMIQKYINDTDSWYVYHVILSDFDCYFPLFDVN